MRDRLGSPPSPAEQERIESWTHGARMALGDRAAEEYARRGAMLEADQAIAYALDAQAGPFD